MGEDFTLASAAIILLHITQIPKLPLIAKEAIRAVAFILEHVSSSKLAANLQNQLQASLVDSVTKHVIVALSPHFTQLHGSAEDLQDKVAALEKLWKDTEAKEVIAQGLLSTSMDHTEEAADGLLNSLKDIKNIIDILTPSLESTQSQINALHLHLTSTPTPLVPSHPHPHSHPSDTPSTQSSPPPTHCYSDALRNNTETALQIYQEISENWVRKNLPLLA
ncbi:hypothetical protein BDN67DRAFT_984634 [Paxillus ammoniavirescens]|nr:hypothetical protein BDN67DRAFT_984634 [Paxillus ammoniavirescens]